jgi:hypothetical protein
VEPLALAPVLPPPRHRRPARDAARGSQLPPKLVLAGRSGRGLIDVEGGEGAPLGAGWAASAECAASAQLPAGTAMCAAAAASSPVCTSTCATASVMSASWEGVSGASCSVGLLSSASAASRQWASCPGCCCCCCRPPRCCCSHSCCCFCFWVAGGGGGGRLGDSGRGGECAHSGESGRGAAGPSAFASICTTGSGFLGCNAHAHRGGCRWAGRGREGGATLLASDAPSRTAGVRTLRTAPRRRTDRPSELYLPLCSCFGTVCPPGTASLPACRALYCVTVKQAREVNGMRLETAYQSKKNLI